MSSELLLKSEYQLSVTDTGRFINWISTGVHPRSDLFTYRH